MNSKYTWKEALREAEGRLEEGQFLEDGLGVKWDIDNLLELPEGVEGFEVDDDNYYCVGWDGRVGITKDNGVNVEWLFNVV